MPYKSKEELPKGVKDALPSTAQEIFRKAFNSALSQYKEEERAMKVAWAAVKKAGYKKIDDKWMKESDIEENLEEFGVGFSISFQQFEAMQKAEQQAFEIQGLTNAFTEMVSNIIYTPDIDKISAIRNLTEEFTARLNNLQEAEQRKAIEKMAENKVELKELEASPITEIEESENSPLHAVVRIIKPGWGNKQHNHYYPKDVLERDAYQFVGAKMYETDHRQQEKSTRTWVSTIEDIIGFDKGAPLAKVAIHDGHFAERLRNLNELGMLDKMECSIYASGLAKGGFKMNGRKGKQVESITGVSSVDWVTRAGAGGAAISLMESEQELNMEDELNKGLEEQETQEEETQEEKPEIQETEEIEEVEIQESDEPQLLEVAIVKEILSETELPDYAKTKLAFSGRFMSKEEVLEAAQAEVDYLKAVTRSGKPFGMGKTEKPESKDKFAEAEQRKNALVENFMNIKKK